MNADGICCSSMAIKSGWVPPRSPYSLIQEDLWPDEFFILISCMLLNCTRRQQVERVLPDLMRGWPTAVELATAEHRDVSSVISCLGFGNRRAGTLIRFSKDYSGSGWSDARELCGIGEYAGRAWDIFCRGELGSSPPKDHALVKYWRWAVMRSDRTHAA
jgi:methyl-CpG-binding domain protein 4